MAPLLTPRYALALALTLAVELPVVAGALRAARLAPVGRGLLAALVVNLVTHPLVWLALSGAAPGGPIRFAAVEAGVVLVEGGLLAAWLRRAPGLVALTALVANLASILAGLALLR